MATALDVSKYFLKLSCPEYGDYISNLKLQKLLYYAQGVHLGLYESPLFEDEIQAWEHGPVVPDIYHYYKDNGQSAIDPDYDFDARESTLSQDQLELIQEVNEVYGRYSAWMLRNMTHNEEPWKSTFTRGVRNKVIEQDLIMKFFKENVVAGDGKEEKDQE